MMSALADPVFDVTIICPECGTHINEYGDDGDAVWRKAVEEYKRHLSDHIEEPKDD
jgi:hypothetical protein